MSGKDNHKEDLDLERFSSLLSALKSGDPDSSSLALRAMASMDYMRFVHIVKWIYFEHTGVFTDYFGRNYNDWISFKNKESYTDYLKRHPKMEDDQVCRMIADITTDDFPIVRPFARVTKEEADRYFTIFKKIIRIVIEKPSRNSSLAQKLYDAGVVDFESYHMFSESESFANLFYKTNTLSACLGEVILAMLDKMRFEAYDILNKKNLLLYGQ